MRQQQVITIYNLKSDEFTLRTIITDGSMEENIAAKARVCAIVNLESMGFKSCPEWQIAEEVAKAEKGVHSIAVGDWATLI